MVELLFGRSFVLCSVRLYVVGRGGVGVGDFWVEGGWKWGYVCFEIGCVKLLVCKCGENEGGIGCLYFGKFGWWF